MRPASQLLPKASRASPALWLPPLLWTALIAFFSSSAMSGEATGTLLRAILPWTTPSTIEALNWIMRKGGHVLEYAILTVLWDRALRQGTSWRGSWIVRGTLFLSLATACLDELHQALIRDRTGSALDVLLDGAASGVTQWGLVHRAGGGSFLWRVTGVLAWTVAPLGTFLLGFNWVLALPTTGLTAVAATAWGVLLIRRYMTRPNRLG